MAEPKPESLRPEEVSYDFIKMVFLEARLAALEHRVLELERTARELSDRLREESEEYVVVLRTVSREQAKEEIKELFHTGGTLFYSDIARRLRLDLPLVVEICQELKNEGEIEVGTDAV